MPHVGFICRVAFMYPNNPGYPPPPPGMPHILAELYLPKEEFWALRGRLPTAISQLPRPLHYNYSSGAINTPIQPWTKERKIENRQNRLKDRVNRKYPMFAEQFITDAIAKKPEYFLEGVGDREAEREQLLENERREFKRFTANSGYLFIYRVADGMHWKRVVSLSYPTDHGGVTAYLDTNTGLIWYAGVGEAGELPPNHETLVEALPAGGESSGVLAELTEMVGTEKLVEWGVQPA